MVTARTEAARRYKAEMKRESLKKQNLIDGIIEQLMPTIKDMMGWEIEKLLDDVNRSIQGSFTPFRTLGDAVSYRESKGKK